MSTDAEEHRCGDCVGTKDKPEPWCDWWWMHTPASDHVEMIQAMNKKVHEARHRARNRNREDDI